MVSTLRIDFLTGGKQLKSIAYQPLFAKMERAGWDLNPHHSGDITRRPNLKLAIQK